MSDKLLSCSTNHSVHSREKESQNKARKVKIFEFHCKVHKVAMDTGNQKVGFCNKINSKFIQEWDISCCSLDSLQIDENFRVLHCKNSFKTLEKFKSEEFRKVFLESSHLFVIIIEGIQDNIDLSECFSGPRPLVVQFLMHGSVETFYRNEKENKFTKFGTLKRISLEKFQQEMQSKIGCNFEILLTGLFSNSTGTFDGNLLNLQADTKNPETFFKISNGATKKNVLCIRFLQLFLQSKGSISNYIPIVDAVQFSGVGTLLALLELPFEILPQQRINEKQQEMLRRKDEYDDNVLIIEALYANNTEALQFLLDQKLDVSASRFYADIAWDHGYFECLVLLLQNDSPFPETFNIDQIDEPIRDIFKNFIKNQISFHHSIKQGNVDEIKKCPLNHHQLKTVYDSTNKSAVSTALEAKQFDIYSLLISQGFSSGIDKSFIKVSSELSYENQRTIRNENKKYFRNSDDSHLVHILAKTKLGPNSGDRRKCFEVIRKLYEKVNESPRSHFLVKFLGQIDHLEIVFDFNRTHVRDLELTANTATLGMTFHYHGYIIFGAKGHEDPEKFSEIAGVIGHEFSHYILQIVYGNNSNPFCLNDTEKIEKINNVVQDLHEHIVDKGKSIDWILDSVFKYPKDCWLLEMIVRVPQLELARTKEFLNELLKIKCVKALFDFFDEITLKDIEKNLNSIKHTQSVRKINELVGLVSEIKSSDVKIVSDKLNSLKIFPNVCHVIVSNAPKLTLSMIHQIFMRNFENEIDFCHIFVTLDSLRNEELVSKIERVTSMNQNIFVVVDGSHNTLSVESLNEAKDQLRSLRNTIFVTSQKIDFPKAKTEEILFLWNDLTKDSQLRILNKFVNFQGISTNLGSLVKGNEKLCEKCSFDDLVYGKIKIGRNLKQLDKIAVHNLQTQRKFTVRVFEQNSRNRKMHLWSNIKSEKYVSNQDSIDVECSTADLIEHAESFKTVILSNPAGHGKSTALINIAKKMKQQQKHKWVEFVDLKAHFKSFEKFKDSKDNFFEFVCATVMSFESDFEEKLFAYLFLVGNVVLFFDGFDEISPRFKDLMLRQLKAFKTDTHNVLFVTTRPHLREQLENIFDRLAFSLTPLTNEDQIEFLTKMNAKIDRETAEKLINKFSKLTKEKDCKNLVGDPFLLRMIAETFTGFNNNILQCDDFYAFFKNYVNKILKVWSKEKGKIADSEVQEVLGSSSTQSLIQIHHNIALRDEFGRIMLPNSDEFIIDRSEWTDEKISRIGIITMIDCKPKFAHRTFKYFLIADFLVTHIQNISLSKVSHILHRALTFGYLEITRIFLDCALKDTKNLYEVFIECFRDTKLFYDIILNSVNENNDTLLHAILQKGKGRKSLFEMAGKINCSFNDLNDHFSGGLIFYAASRNGGKILEMLAKYHNGNYLYSNQEGNIFHRLARNRNEGSVRAMTEILKVKIGIAAIRKLLRDKDNTNFSPLDVMMFSEKTQSSCKEFFQVLSELFDRVELLNIFKEKSGAFETTCFTIASEFNTSEIIEVLFNFMQNSLNPAELKNILAETNKDGVCALYSSAALNSKTVFVKIYEIFQSIFENDKMKILLKSPDVNGQNYFHLAVENENNKGLIETIVSVMIKHLSSEEIKIMMNQKSKAGFTPLQFLMAGKKIPKCLDPFLKILSEMFTPSELKTILKEKEEKYGINCLGLASEQSNPEFIEILLKFMENLFDSVELKEILNETDGSGFTIFLRAANFNTKSVFNKIIDFSDKILSETEMKNLLQVVDDDGGNLFHSAVVNRKNEGMIETVLETLKYYFPLEQIKIMLDQKTIKDGLIPFHCLLSINESGECFEKFLQLLIDVYDPKEIRNILFQKEEQFSNNCFAIVSEKNTPEMIQALLKILESFLSPAEIKEILCETDNRGCTVLHSLTKFNTERSFETVFEIFRSELSVAKVISLLRLTDNDGQNLFHSAAINNKDDEMIHTVFSTLKDNLLVEKLKEMMNQKEKDGFTPLHILLINNNNLECCEEFFRVLTFNFDHVELAQVLMEHGGEFKTNCLGMVATSNTLKVVEAFIKFMKRSLNSENLQKILQETNKSGQTALHFAAVNMQKEVFVAVYEFLKAKFSDDELSNLMQKVDINGANVFFYAIESGNIETFYEIAKKVLSVKETNDMLVALDKYNRNIFHCSFQQHSLKSIQDLLEFGRRNISPEMFRNALKTSKIDGCNIYHYAACNKNPDIPDFAWSFICDILGKEASVEMLKEKEFDVSENIVTALVKFNDLKNFEAFFHILKTNLNFKDLKMLFLNQTKKGFNIIQTAVDSDGMNMQWLEKLFDFLESFFKFSHEEIISFLNHKNLDGQTAQQIAIKNGKAEIISFLSLKTR